jgi:putative multiple sugar transport system ATP-binding protein
MRNITKTFPGVKALDSVNLRVKRREIHTLVGENGAGKSTLMKVLSGVYPHGTYNREIIFEGKNCAFTTVKISAVHYRHSLLIVIYFILIMYYYGYVLNIFCFLHN